MASRDKNTLVIFCDIKRIVHNEFILPGQMVNSAYYCEVYGDYVKVREKFIPTFGGKVLTVASRQRTASHFLFHRETFYQKQRDCRPHPPYSPDLSPWYLSLFPRLKKNVSGSHFDTTEAAILTQLRQPF
jgi:hypothetical protein